MVKTHGADGQAEAGVDVGIAELYERRVNPLLVVLSGPSGVGKDTVIGWMRARGLPFHLVVTATSRPPRPGEVDGVDYVFTTDEEFSRMIAGGELFECAVVYGQYKGIPKKHVREALTSEQDVVMRLDVQGAVTIRDLIPDAILIFLLPGSEEELIGRLKARRADAPEAIARRLEAVREELRSLDKFDYIVFNRDGQLDAVVDQISAIMTTEKRRVHQRVVRV